MASYCRICSECKCGSSIWKREGDGIMKKKKRMSRIREKESMFEYEYSYTYLYCPPLPRT